MSGLSGLIQSIQSAYQNSTTFIGFFQELFSNTSFNVLWNWLHLPEDLWAVFTGLTLLTITIASIGFIRKLILFFG